MRPFLNPRVAATFDEYPTAIRKQLFAIRELIFTTAASSQVGELEETLKWGEPSYLTAQSGTGTTIRLAWKKATRPVTTQASRHMKVDAKLLRT